MSRFRTVTRLMRTRAVTVLALAGLASAVAVGLPATAAAKPPPGTYQCYDYLSYQFFFVLKQHKYVYATQTGDWHYKPAKDKVVFDSGPAYHAHYVGISPFDQDNQRIELFDKRTHQELYGCLLS
jgi:hypothetical protein